MNKIEEEEEEQITIHVEKIEKMELINKKRGEMNIGLGKCRKKGMKLIK